MPVRPAKGCAGLAPRAFRHLGRIRTGQDFYILSLTVAFNGQVFADGFALRIWAEITPLYGMSD
jgi:hypothetical protein